MIQANELRLGNIVSYNYKTDLLAIVEWAQKESVTIIFFERQPDLVNGACCSPEDLIPVEITEEVLLKSNFSEIPHYLKLRFDDNEQNYVMYDKKTCEFLFVIENQLFLKKIEHYHILQNLFFALSGIELSFVS